MAKKSKSKRKITKSRITKKAAKVPKNPVNKCRCASDKSKTSKVKKMIKIANMRAIQKHQSRGFFAKLFNK